MHYTNGKDVNTIVKSANKNTLVCLVCWRLCQYMIWSKWVTIGQSKGQEGCPSMQWEDVGGHEPDLRKIHYLSATTLSGLVQDSRTHVE